MTFRRDPVREFRDFLQIDARLGHLHWLMQHNGGVFLPPWGKVEQWLLSVQHDRDDVDRFASNFARFAEAVAAEPPVTRLALDETADPGEAAARSGWNSWSSRSTGSRR